MKPVIDIAKVVGRVSKSVMKCKPIAKAVIKVNKNKPEILAVGGTICVVAAFGWAIYEAVTVKESLEASSDKVKVITEKRDEELQKEGISEEEKKEIIKASKTDLMKARTDGVLVVAKKFAGPAAVLFVGMKMGHDGFKILRARNIMLGLALKNKDDILRFYRDNVRADLGKEADLKYMRGVVGEAEVEDTKKDELGNEVKTVTKVPVIKDHENPWRFEFNEDNFDSWKNDTDLNLYFLGCSEQWWNHEMQTEDNVTMYDILKFLRFKFDKAKARMTKKEWQDFMYFIRNYGWWKGSDGDGFISFGIHRAINDAARRRMSDVIFIEFNCDGCLLNM